MIIETKANESYFHYVNHKVTLNVSLKLQMKQRLVLLHHNFQVETLFMLFLRKFLNPWWLTF